VVGGDESMRVNSEDKTIKRNYIQKYRFLINEYKLVKAKKHQTYRFAQDFYKAHNLDRRTFLKYYNRYMQSHEESDLLPRKRGPRWKSRRFIPYIEQKVIEQRLLGLNRYEIVRVLSKKLGEYTPSPSGVYKIIKRNGLNKLKKQMKESKRKIIKEKAGEMAHIDTHYLSKDLLLSDRKRRYLVAVIDDATRIAWAEVVEDITALTVMFSVMRMFNMLMANYNIQFVEVLTDNGPEFGPKISKNKMNHPFERMLTEIGVKHRNTKPYRPQTNGKIERFWRTLNEDLIDGTTFETQEEFKKELEEYIWYYNNERPHQALNGQTPVEFLKKCPRIT
jgi:transposase InsO family protein